MARQIPAVLAVYFRIPAVYFRFFEKKIPAVIFRVF